MRPSNPGGRDLGPLSRDVLVALAKRTDEGVGFTREEAIAVVKRANGTDDDRFWANAESDRIEREIDGVLDGLLERGYLYEVDGQLRITERDGLE